MGGCAISSWSGSRLEAGLDLKIWNALRSVSRHAALDGAAPGRNCYTDFATQAPQDTVVLTLGCNKYRFNRHDFGAIGGIPRLLDIGRCNDAYFAIKIATALADAFGCGVNELPLSLVISWLEHKAAAAARAADLPDEQLYSERFTPA